VLTLAVSNVLQQFIVISVTSVLGFMCLIDVFLRVESPLVCARLLILVLRISIEVNVQNCVKFGLKLLLTDSYISFV